MTACAESGPGRESTWISPHFIQGYTAFHKAGHAHSVEVWQKDQLVGGVYGVSIGGLFAGESMFHRATDASKIALFVLFDHLREKGFRLFDTQVLNPFTAQLGAVEIPRKDYLRRLEAVRDLPASFR
jgi:leucyl/phenylalanyl-tRNA--protein transferase